MKLDNDTKLIRSLSTIAQRVADIGVCLLRYQEQDECLTRHATVKSVDEQKMVCVVTGLEKSDFKKLINKRVNLIQKSDNDYIYICGRVPEHHVSNQRIVLIHILKASWFVRRSKGRLSWLQEKHVFETMALDELDMAS